MDKAKTAKSDIKGKNPTPTKSDQNKSSVTGKKELVEIVREKSGLGKERLCCINQEMDKEWSEGMEN